MHVMNQLSLITILKIVVDYALMVLMFEMKLFMSSTVVNFMGVRNVISKDNNYIIQQWREKIY
jgi:hypothetical protein